MNMSRAIDNWLDAREAWMHSNSFFTDISQLEATTDMLYVAFVQGFVNKSLAPVAFFAFHNLLAEEHDKGMPRRAELHLIPTIAGRA